MSTIYRTFWYRTSRWIMLYKEKYCTMILSVLMHFDIQKSILIRYQSISSQIQLLLTSRARYSTLLRNIIVQYIDGGLKAVNIIVELFEVFYIIELCVHKESIEFRSIYFTILQYWTLMTNYIYAKKYCTIV